MSAHNAIRSRVLESLIAAGVQEVLAIGIVDVLAAAGFSRLETSATQIPRSAQNDAAVVILSPSIRTSQARISSFPRLPPIMETLPTLLLRYDQRIEGAVQKRTYDSYSYARIAVRNCPADVLSPKLEEACGTCVRRT